MKRLDSVGIFYFNGTGNTELLAERYAETFCNHSVATQVQAIERFTKTATPPVVERFAAIGIGYPIHAMNAPRIVFDFIRLLPIGMNRPVFIFKSPGDPLLRGGSTLPVRRALAAKSACTGCGHCAAICPSGNVAMAGLHPHFGHSCIWCMRCVYACPAQAIYFKWGDFFRLKNGYNIRQTLADNKAQATYLTPTTRGYYRRFRSYTLADD